MRNSPPGSLRSQRPVPLHKHSHFSVLQHPPRFSKVSVSVHHHFDKEAVLLPLAPQSHGGAGQTQETLTHSPASPRPQAAQKWRFEVIHFPKYCPPFSSKHTGRWRPQEGSSPAAWPKRTPRGTPRRCRKERDCVRPPGWPSGPTPQGFGETGKGGGRLQREKRQAGCVPGAQRGRSAISERNMSGPNGQSQAGNAHRGRKPW